MAIIPNNVFERNQVAGGRQMTEQAQQLANASRANTPPQAAVTARGNRPPPTPGFLVDGVTSQTNQVPANFGNSGSQGYGVGAALADLGQRFRGVQEQSPAQPPSTVGGVGLNPNRRGVISSPQIDFNREVTLGVGSAQNTTPQDNPGALEGRGDATVINPQASGGPGVGVGANNPTTVDPNALQGAIQAGGSATNMGYWAREGGPRNYIPGTQANSSNLSVMPMAASSGYGPGGPPFPGAPAPGTPIVHGYGPGGAGINPQANVGGSGPNGAYQPGVDPMYMDPNRGPQTQPLVMGQGGGPGAGVGGLDGAIDAYLSASPGGGSEGSRNRQQLRNVMEALAGREDTNTRAGATIQSANIGANADLTTTGMTQTGLDRRAQEDNAIRWDAANRGWTEIEQGMQGDPMDQIRLSMLQEAYANNDVETAMSIITNTMPRVPELVTTDGVENLGGTFGPDGVFRPFDDATMTSAASRGILSRTQLEQIMQNRGQ